MAEIVFTMRSSTCSIVYHNLTFLILLLLNFTLHLQVRDPMDTVFGVYKQQFTDENMYWASDKELLVDQYVSYLEVVKKT